MNTTGKLLKARAKTALKLILVIALLGWLSKRGFLSLEATGRAFTRLDLILPAVCISVVAQFLGIIRWQILLRAQAMRLPLWRTAQLTMIGVFFNIALPGAVSGDFVKAFYVAKEIQGQRGRAFGSILFDRVIGLSALVLVSAGAMLLEFKSLAGTPLLSAIRVFMSTAAIVVAISIAYLFLVREKHDPVLRLLRWAATRVKPAGSLVRIYEGLRHYHHHRMSVLTVLAISIAIHMGICGAAFLYARALGVENLALAPVFIVVPLGLLVTAVPIMPGGVGTGHAAFSWLFHFLGTERGADIFTLQVLTQLGIAAIGGLIYLRFRATEPALETQMPLNTG